MSKIRCFFLEPSDQVEQSLRRFVFSSREKCPLPWGYLNAATLIGRCHKAETTDVHGDVWPHADPRWPKACGCGYVFTDADEWQYNPTSLYRRLDTDELVTLADAPVGAMWNAYWFRGMVGYQEGPDGLLLCVKTPGGDWLVDGPASDGDQSKPAWTRTGVARAAAPTLTVRPSIVAGKGYHGFLTDGWLVPC